MQPIYESIPYVDPQEIFTVFYQRSWSMWLDSSDASQGSAMRSRYSFIAVDPFDTLICREGRVYFSGEILPDIDIFTALKNSLSKFSLLSIEGLPPLQTGLVGMWSYDLCHEIEPVPLPSHNDINFPQVAVGLYDLVIAFDHHLKKTWMISSGFPYLDDKKRLTHAKQRLLWLKEQLKTFVDLPQRPLISDLDIQSNFDQAYYKRAVKNAIEYIKAGDIFEVNLSQRFSAVLPKNYDPYALYLDLRQANHAPFSAYIHFDQYTIASASPERFLKLSDRRVETRPIKGTRPRGNTEAEDKSLANELLCSDKDRAENIMIVDLMRNDLSRVCRDDSLRVTQLCAIETFKNVHHLVSAVEGDLSDNMTAVDLLAHSFPGGSITGAPKVRAMQIIAEIEQIARGPYCGSIGYISFHGDMDLSIVIRTFVVHDDLLTFHGGGAIIMDSDPAAEYAESCMKVAALRNVLTQSLKVTA